jgi:glycosyltransferase involved in cell wall biosynthesis
VKVLLVTNFASHYRAPFFERLAKAVDVDYIFFSAGAEQYWQGHLGTTRAEVRAQTIVGRTAVGGVRVNPSLVRELWTRDYDVLVKCINGRFELASSYAIAKARNKPFVFWTTIWWHPVTFLGWLSQPPLLAVYRGADAIVTDGRHITNFVAGHGVDPVKIFSAEFSVDNDWFMRPVEAAERDRLRRSLDATDRPLVLAVSRLVPEKGLDWLVRAAARLSDLRPVVAVVGTGPLADSLAEQARRESVDLRLLGGLPASSMPAVYAAADVYAMPSVTTPAVREPWGLGVNEAHCRRLPVVVSDAVGAAAGGLVVHNETGAIVPERDDVSLAAALRRLICDRALAARLAAAGHDRVHATNYDAMVDAFTAAIDHAVAAHAARGHRPG